MLHCVWELNWGRETKTITTLGFSLVFSQPPLSFLPFSTLPNKTYDLGATGTSRLGDHVNIGPKSVYFGLQVGLAL